MVSETESAYYSYCKYISIVKYCGIQYIYYTYYTMYSMYNIPKMVKVQTTIFLHSRKIYLHNGMNKQSNMRTAALYEIWGYHSPRLSIVYLAIVKSNVSER